METALLIWFTAYLAITISKFGVLDSISDSWYKWGDVGQERVFVIFCGGLGLGLIGFIETHQLSTIASLMLVIAFASAWFVAVAADFKYGQKDRAEGKRATRVDIIHYAVSGTLIGCSLIALWVDVSWIFPAAFSTGTVAILILKAVNRKVRAIWWIEVWAFAVIDLGLYIV